MVSIKKNFLYSSVLTTAGYIFPMITYPYASRVLGVDNIGIFNFVDSIISYFILISMMGISVIGIREVAAVRNDSVKLNKVFSSLVILNSITTVFAIVGLILTVILIPKLRANSTLFFIGISKIFFNYLLVEWLFKGLEDFKYITLRTLGVRILLVIAIFALVHTKNDLGMYYGAICGVVVVNAIVNCIYARKFVSFDFRNISLRPYVKSFFILGINGFLVSMYTTFNTVYLGFVASEEEVGYYGTAIKLYTIILALYTAFTGVMLPRMSALVHDNNKEEFMRLLFKSLRFLISCSIPAILFVEFFTPQIVELLAGNGYEGAIIPMRIVIPLVFIIGYEQIIIIQALMPLKKDSKIFFNSVIGAITGILLNLLLVQKFFAIGSSIVWVLSEILILILSQICIEKYIKIKFPFERLLKTILFYFPLCVGYILLNKISDSIYIALLGGIATVVYFYVLHRFFLHDEIGKFFGCINMLKRR